MVLVSYFIVTNSVNATVFKEFSGHFGYNERLWCVSSLARKSYGILLICEAVLHRPIVVPHPKPLTENLHFQLGLRRHLF
jgi:hypothetical protein